MISIRREEKRGITKTTWLESAHSFSFGNYYDPENMGFGALRVINDDKIVPGGGFAMHGHKNIEIFTCVLQGALAHRDSLGNGSIIRPGDVQLMSAGSGIRHSEFNASASEPVHLLQIWIAPERAGTEPSYQQASFDISPGRFQTVISPGGQNGALDIKSDARIAMARLAPGGEVAFVAESARAYYLHVARGAVDFGRQKMKSGDALALRGEAGAFAFASGEGAELLLFDLP